MDSTIIIVAGGSGSRMNSSVPKQFLEIRGYPLVMHTIKNFYLLKPEMKIRLVLPKNQLPVWKELIKKFRFSIPHQVFIGGQTRFHSVLSGLKNLPDGELVAIHDGVRPFVSALTLENCLASATKHGSAIPVVEVYETMRKTEGSESKTVSRDDFRLVQTPQVFRSEIIVKAYSQPYNECFTDDASVVEKFGYKVHLVEGNRENIKITNQIDLVIAEALVDSVWQE